MIPPRAAAGQRGEASGMATSQTRSQTTESRGRWLPLADRYRVLARVGVGGTAIVYRCVDLRTEHVVAVKVLRTNGQLIPEAQARFRREADLAARLAHPHIVRVLDYGRTIPPPTPARVPWADDADEPVPYLAMEYVFGSTLKELVKRGGPLPLDWVWRLGEQLCAALGVAHAAGVVHRDVKPQNVMILDSRFELLAKLTDFGIARQVGGDLTTLTAAGQVLGTPDYLSPEQVIGDPGGPSSDLYALGVVLFELITGRLPFEAETPLAAASRRMVVDAPPLSYYRADVPEPLEEVIALALRREVDERFADAAEFTQALRWSRQRSPRPPAAESGSWVLSVRHPAPPPEPAPVPDVERATPAVAAEAEELAGSKGSETQPTVLRVAPLEPVDAPDAALPAAAPDAADTALDTAPDTAPGGD